MKQGKQEQEKEKEKRRKENSAELMPIQLQIPHTLTKSTRTHRLLTKSSNPSSNALIENMQVSDWTGVLSKEQPHTNSKHLTISHLIPSGNNHIALSAMHPGYCLSRKAPTTHIALLLS